MTSRFVNACPSIALCSSLSAWPPTQAATIGATLPTTIAAAVSNAYGRNGEANMRARARRARPADIGRDGGGPAAAMAGAGLRRRLSGHYPIFDRSRRPPPAGPTGHGRRNRKLIAAIPFSTRAFHAG